MKKSILVHLNLSNLLVNALMMVATTAPWSNRFHPVMTVRKNIFYYPACT